MKTPQENYDDMNKSIKEIYFDSKREMILESYLFDDFLLKQIAILKTRIDRIEKTRDEIDNFDNQKEV